MTGHEAKWMVSKEQAAGGGREGLPAEGQLQGEEVAGCWTSARSARRASEFEGGQQSLRELAGHGADAVGEEGELTAKRDSRKPPQGTRGHRRRAIPPRVGVRLTVTEAKAASLA